MAEAGLEQSALESRTELEAVEAAGVPAVARRSVAVVAGMDLVVVKLLLISMEAEIQHTGTAAHRKIHLEYREEGLKV